MGTSKSAAVFLMTMQILVKITSVHANDEMSPKGANSVQYSVADAWGSLIWNRFPEEFFPLFVSPLLEKGRIEEAQNRSRVWNVSKEDVESYSGYITVNKTYNSNMFFWFFPAETNKTEAPVLLWLNGGPGRTSLVGALVENGPLEVNKNGTQLNRRAVAWTRNFSVLYVDNPVGVGYSFTKNNAGLSKTMDDVTTNLYRLPSNGGFGKAISLDSVLVQFFQMFPQYSRVPFYVGGQSYAGKYVPALGYYIHQRNTDPQTPPHHLMNFKGIYVGAGYCAPQYMMPVFADYLFHSGLISNSHRQSIKDHYNKIITEWQDNKRPNKTIDYLYQFFSKRSVDSGIDSLDNLLGSQATNDHLMGGLNRFMRSAAARIKLHVGLASTPHWMLWSDTVAIELNSDILVDTLSENAFLMDHYKVLHYSGNLDVVVNVPMTEAFLDHVQWAGREEYQLKHRRLWHVDGQLAGWFVRVRNFTRVIIRNSGHMVPYDQPERGLQMMKNFIFDQPFKGERDAE